MKSRIRYSDYLIFSRDITPFPDLAPITLLNSSMLNDVQQSENCHELLIILS